MLSRDCRLWSFLFLGVLVAQAFLFIFGMAFIPECRDAILKLDLVWRVPCIIIIVIAIVTMILGIVWSTDHPFTWISWLILVLGALHCYRMLESARIAEAVNGWAVTCGVLLAYHGLVLGLYIRSLRSKPSTAVVLVRRWH